MWVGSAKYFLEYKNQTHDIIIVFFLNFISTAKGIKYWSYEAQSNDQVYNIFRPSFKGLSVTKFWASIRRELGEYRMSSEPVVTFVAKSLHALKNLFFKSTIPFTSQPTKRIKTLSYGRMKKKRSVKIVLNLANWYRFIIISVQFSQHGVFMKL